MSTGRTQAKIDEWTKPSVILQILGILGLVGGAYLSFDGRIAKTEKATELNAKDIDANTKAIAEIKSGVKEANQKLDAIVLRELDRAERNGK